MWIFGKKRSNPAQMDEKYFEIAGMITNQDPEVMSEMKEYAIDKWWLMIDILEQHNYICTRDWKDELQDFLHFLFQTKRAVSENIEI